MTRGEVPTNPELLDYLATELADGKWDPKNSTSESCYRHYLPGINDFDRQARERDPENRSAARGPRLRLTQPRWFGTTGSLFRGSSSKKPVARVSSRCTSKNAWKTVDGFMSDRLSMRPRREAVPPTLYVYRETRVALSVVAQLRRGQPR